MSRIGKMPIEIPQGVEVKIDGSWVTVKGPKGELKRFCDHRVKIKLENKTLLVEKISNEGEAWAQHGLIRSLLYNMVQGVFKGFEKNLELTGVGYRAAKQGKKLALSMGFSHPVEIDPPAGIEFVVEGQNKVKVIGPDKELVGQVAANIKAVRPVEPYKGKGIKYAGERVRKKAGKAAKAAGGAA